jgi:hypothetical protein
MTCGVKQLKTKVSVNLAALEGFLEEFDDPEELIGALVAMTDFAATHPDFGGEDFPGDEAYFLADQATEVLWAFFCDGMYCDPDAGPPTVLLNPQRGTLDLIRKRYRTRRRPVEERSYEAAVAPVRLRQIRDTVN